MILQESCDNAHSQNVAVEDCRGVNAEKFIPTATIDDFDSQSRPFGEEFMGSIGSLDFEVLSIDLNERRRLY